MKGSIHSDQTCPLCGSRFRSQEPKGMFCPSHPKQSPTKFKVIFEKITRRFNDYFSALQFLTGLRFQEGSGQMDARDYQIKARPLSFDKLAEEWLEIKKATLRPKAHQPVRNALERAVRVWGSANIKSIQYADMEDFLNSLALASKTKKNTLDSLKQFWSWAVIRYDIPPMKAWPGIGHVEMRFRKTVSIETQERIVAKVKEHIGIKRPRSWLAIKWLTTYISIRPGEMLSLTEGNIDRQRGLLIIEAQDAKESRPKVVQLLDADREILSQFREEHPAMFFFRHETGRFAGRQFGPQLLWTDWKAACAALGIEGVDLYGGTKHSTAMGLRNVASYEEVRKMTGHTTNKAFDRYLQLEGEKMKELYARREALLRADNGLTTAFEDIKEPIIKYYQ